MGMNNVLRIVGRIGALGILGALLYFIQGPLDERYLQGLAAQEFVEPPLTQEDVVNLAKPAIVRVVTEYWGHAEIAPFTFDIDVESVDKPISLRFLKGQKPLKLELNQLFTGSGFVVNADGTIVTNAHVVSDYSMKDEAIADLVEEIMYREFLKLSDPQFRQLEKHLTDFNAWAPHAFEDAIKLFNASTFSATKKVTVLNPSSIESNIDNLLKKGFPATVVYANEQYDLDEKDIAIIRIAEGDLPTIALSDSDAVATGQRVSVFGFPANASATASDFLQSSFTQGVVSALKDTRTKAFKLIQTDAKISAGSSGGPLMNEKGQVLGVITYQSGFSEEGGDNFAFAIPLPIVKEVLSQQNIENTVTYREHVTRGLALLQSSHCKAAMKEFSLAMSNQNFETAPSLKKYKDQCQALISSGQSIDGIEDEIKRWVKEHLTWVGAGVGVLAMMLVVVFVRRWKKRSTFGVIISESPMAFEPDDAPIVDINPQLYSYVQEARRTGVTDEVIRQELLGAGWPLPAVEDVLALNS